MLYPVELQVQTNFCKYLNEKDDRQAGRTPQVKNDCLALRDVVNRFLTSKKLAMQSGERSPRTWRDYYDSCARLLEFIGKDKPVASLASVDFEQYRAHLAKGGLLD